MVPGYISGLLKCSYLVWEFNGSLSKKRHYKPWGFGRNSFDHWGCYWNLWAVAKVRAISVSTSPFTVVVYGDGLSCERGNDAQRARCNGINPWGRLECIEPSAQEFHKEMLLLQVYYYDLFKGSSASDRGTLCQLKNIFNFRKVKSDVVSDNFNYALELMCLITEGFICLLTMSLLELETDESVPANIPTIAETSTLDERQKYFKKSALQFSGKYCPKWISCL